MPIVRIEIDRGNGWEVRAEGKSDKTRDELIDALPSYCVSYIHRALLDGKVVAVCHPSDVHESLRSWKKGRRPA